MRTALVVINPLAGMRWRRRDSELHALLFGLAQSGVRTLTTTTRGPHHPPEQLFDGLEEFDTVLAVGGDGTVNEVLQALMMNGHRAALGVVPFGSGNLVAKELGLRRKVEGLVESLHRARPQPCPVGCIEQLETGQRRYWLGAAGIGADARVICALSPSAKARFGIAAYYAEGARQLIFPDEPFPVFAVEFEDLATGRKRTETVAQVVAERIGYFGNFLEASDAPALAPDQMRLVLFKTARRWAFLNYGFRLVASRAQGSANVVLKDIEVVRTREILCRRADPSGAATQLVYGTQKSLAEIDGELFGELPVRLSVVRRQVQVLRPLS